MDRDIYRYVNSVDKINEKVQEGIPFREAYLQIALEIEQGRFVPGERAKHSHTGSIDNLSNDRIKLKLNKVKKETNIKKYMNFRKRFIEKITKDHGI
jgi:argininosuccinate lyase